MCDSLACNSLQGSCSSFEFWICVRIHLHEEARFCRPMQILQKRSDYPSFSITSPNHWIWLSWGLQLEDSATDFKRVISTIGLPQTDSSNCFQDRSDCTAGVICFSIPLRMTLHTDVISSSRKDSLFSQKKSMLSKVKKILLPRWINSIMWPERDSAVKAISGYLAWKLLQSKFWNICPGCQKMY